MGITLKLCLSVSVSAFDFTLCDFFLCALTDKMFYLFSYFADTSDPFANTFSSDLAHCIDLTEKITVCEETKEMIREAMGLPKEQQEARLEEIRLHQRFLKKIENERRIIGEKTHRRKQFGIVTTYCYYLLLKL